MSVLTHFQHTVLQWQYYWNAYQMTWCQHPMPYATAWNTSVPHTNRHIRRHMWSEIELLIAKTSKTCQLDQMPSNHVKDNNIWLASVITNITNASLSEGVMLNQLNTALVHPRLKKPSLYRHTLKNYRPVSNLPQLSTIFDKVIADRLNTHLCNESLTDTFQSAYKRNHSNETALLWVVNEIGTALDRRQCTVIAMIDLAASFDTIGHGIILARLQQRYGIDGVALRWMRSYLSERTSSLKLVYSRVPL